MVSFPATVRSRKKSSSSSSESCSPSMSTVVSTLIRSSCGSTRFRPNSADAYAYNSSDACWATSPAVWYSGSWLPIIRLDQSNIRWRSSSGTPSSSAMTSSGSSAAISVTKSAAASLDHPVDDGVGGGMDPVVELGDGARSEALVHQAPVPGVEGRVHVEHEHLLLREVLLGEVPEVGRLAVRREVLVVAVDRGAVRVGGHRPEARPVGVPVLSVPPDRRVAPEEREPLVGHPLDEAGRIGQVDVVEGDAADVDIGAGHRVPPGTNRTRCPARWIVCPTSAGVNGPGREGRLGRPRPGAVGSAAGADRR